MTKFLRYWDYTGQENSPLTCPKCGWTGLPGNHVEQYSALLDVCCPQCREMLLIVLFPTIEETREAAAGGNERAARELAKMEAGAKAMRPRYEALLRSADQLPDLDGGCIVVEWDCERGDDGEPETVLRVGPQEIWREFAFWEGITRFEGVVEILRAKYGPRLVEVRPTQNSLLYLLGDIWNAYEIVERINDGLRGGMN